MNTGIDQLAATGVLTPLAQSQRKRPLEAVGLLDLLAAAKLPGRLTTP